MKAFLKKVKTSMSRSHFTLLAIMLAVTSVLGDISLPNSAHAAVGSVTQYTVPYTGEYVSGLAIGPDDNIWYTASGPTINTYISKLTTSGTFTQYANRTANSRYPGAMSKGSDGNVWYSEQYTVSSNYHYRIVSMTTTGTVLGQYNLPSDKYVSSMALGPDGAVWFTEDGNKIGKITTSGLVTEYSISVGGVAADMTDITVGPDGNLWFTSGRVGATIGNAVGKITTAGAYTIYQVPTYNAYLSGITTGPDGNLWFTEKNGNKIGKITTTGTITQYSSIPTTNAQPSSITTGSDGALWFTEGTKIGRITTSGTITEYDIPGGSSGNGPSMITTGPDGAVWFRTGGSGIARMATELTNQSISFSSTPPTGATIESPAYAPAASATSGLPVTIAVDSSSSSICSIDGSGNISYQSAGTCTLNANQAGNVDYKPASQVQQSFIVLPVNADLSVALDCPATANMGDTVTCTITATNNGPAASQNTALSAVFPAILSGATVTGGATLSGQNISWTTPSLASGDSATITLSVTASAPGKARLNAAVLQTSPDPDNSNNFTNSTLVIS